jgi:uncharacterized protein (DUF1810 family)
VSVWFSPFPLESAFKQRLLSCGWSHWTGQLTELPPDGILIYDTPDRLLSCHEQHLSFGIICEGYKSLLTYSGPNANISAWRLSACTDDSLALDYKQVVIEKNPPNPEPLAALIIKSVHQSQPELVDLYLDLELRAELLGSEPDVHYRKRLQNALNPDELNESFHRLLLCRYNLVACIKSRELTEQSLEELKRNESNLVLTQQDLQQQLMHQENSYRHELTALQHQLSKVDIEKQHALKHLQETQAELEHHFIGNRERSSENAVITQMLEAARAENQDIQHQLTSQVDNYRLELMALQHQLSEAVAEKEHALKHLQETQAELEHHFIGNRERSSENAVITQMLEAARAENQALQDNLVQQDQHNQQQIISLHNQVKELSTESNNALRHLRQTQNELEHYYNLCRSHATMQVCYEQLLVRSQKLLCSFLN